MATIEQPPPLLPPEIDALLGGLRARIRLYVWLHGIATVLALAGLAFWISLLVDQPWMLESSREARALLLAGAAIAFLFLIARLVLARGLARLTRRNMAVLLERRFPGFNDSLLTSVELAGRRPEAAGYNPEMLAHTTAAARARSTGVRLAEVFDPAPLLRAVAAATVLVGAAVAFALLLPDAFGVWARRNLLLSQELWPRRTDIVVEGFRDGVAKVARGADFPLVVRADAAKLIPEIVQIRYRTDEGFRARENMERDGIARPGVDEFQRYSHTFQGVLTSIRLDVLGGDDRERDLRIEVVDSPTLGELSLWCEFPAYMDRAPRELAVSGAVQLPEGTIVTVRAVANKDLVRVEVDSPADDSATPSAEDSAGAGPAESQRPAPQTIELSGSGESARRFELPLGALSEDRVLLFSLLDADGIRNREPFRLALGITPDEPPRIDVELRGIGSAITPQARLPLVGELSDDYGLADAWFDYVVDEGKDAQQSGTRPLASRPNGRNGMTIDEAAGEALDARDELLSPSGEPLALAPGQTLQVGVKAQDSYSLGEAPHVGVGQRFLLDVVTPDQLRTILESRELNLRQRFETIVGEVEDGTETLSALDFAPPEQPAAAGDGDTATPGADDEGEAEASLDDRLTEVALRVERALQNSRKNAQETRGVAEAFDDIRLELINNRVDTEELKSRLEQGISTPLRLIADEMFPELERRLEALSVVQADPAAAPPARDAAVAQAHAVLLAMRQVLDRMLELETFNEALALLRDVIELQERLNAQTEEGRKRQARELLEEE